MTMTALRGIVIALMTTLVFASPASMAKLFAGDTAMWVSERAVQILGGYGYTTINIIMSSSNDKLISRILRRKKSIEADKYRKEILLDGDRNAIVRSRIIEDLFGKKQDEEITKIIQDLENNQNESISETAKMYRKSIS